MAPVIEFGFIGRQRLWNYRARTGWRSFFHNQPMSSQHLTEIAHANNEKKKLCNCQRILSVKNQYFPCLYSPVPFQWVFHRFLFCGCRESSGSLKNLVTVLYLHTIWGRHSSFPYSVNLRTCCKHMFKLPMIFSILTCQVKIHWRISWLCTVPNSNSNNKW